MHATLTPLGPEHVDALFAGKNSAAVLAHIPGDFPLDPVAFTEKCAAQIAAGATRDQATWVVLVDGVVAGSIGHFHRPGGGPEIGYFLGERWWGQGIATRAVGLVLAELRSLGVTGDVHASHAMENPSSGRVLRKAGFRPSADVPFTMPDGSVELDKGYVITL